MRCAFPPDYTNLKRVRAAQRPPASTSPDSPGSVRRVRPVWRVIRRGRGIPIRRVPVIVIVRVCRRSDRRAGKRAAEEAERDSGTAASVVAAPMTAAAMPISRIGGARDRGERPRGKQGGRQRQPAPGLFGNPYKSPSWSSTLGRCLSCGTGSVLLRKRAGTVPYSGNDTDEWHFFGAKPVLLEWSLKEHSLLGRGRCSPAWKTKG